MGFGIKAGSNPVSTTYLLNVDKSLTLSMVYS